MRRDSRPILHVARVLEVREKREEPSSFVWLPSRDVDLERSLEQAQQDTAGARVLLGRILEQGQSLVPAAEHRERVRHLRQRRPFGRAGPQLPREGERLTEEAEGGFVAIAPKLAVGRNEVQRARLLGQVMRQRDLECMPVVGTGLLGMASAVGNRSLAAERKLERAGVTVGLGDVQRELGELGAALEVAEEPVVDRELSGEDGEVLVGRIVRDDVEGPLHLRDCLSAVPSEGKGIAKLARCPGRAVRVPGALVQGNRLLQPSPRCLGVGSVACHLARADEQARPLRRVVAQVARLLEIPPGLTRRREGCGAFACAGEHLDRPLLDLRGIFGVRLRLVCIDVVRRDHLDHLVLFARERRR